MVVRGFLSGYRGKLAVAVFGGRSGTIYGAKRYADVMEHLLEHAVIDWAACADVEINPRKLSGTPILRGSRMPADGIVENYMDGMPAEEIAGVFELPVDSVRALLAFAVERNSAMKP